MRFIRWMRRHWFLSGFWISLLGLYLGLYFAGIFNGAPLSSTLLRPLCMQRTCSTVFAGTLRRPPAAFDVTVYAPATSEWHVVLMRTTAAWRTALQQDGIRLLSLTADVPTTSVNLTVHLAATHHVGMMDVRIAPPQSWSTLLRSTAHPSETSLLTIPVLAAYAVGHRLPNRAASIAHEWTVFFDVQTPRSQTRATGLTGFGFPVRRSGLLIYNRANHLVWFSSRTNPDAAWQHGGFCTVAHLLVPTRACPIA